MLQLLTSATAGAKMVTAIKLRDLLRSEPGGTSMMKCCENVSATPVTALPTSMQATARQQHCASHEQHSPLLAKAFASPQQFAA